MMTGTIIGSDTVIYNPWLQTDVVNASVFCVQEEQEEITREKHGEKVRKQEETTTTNSLFFVDFSPVDYPIAFDALKQLNCIAHLPDNWDSYGSPRLGKELRLNAGKFIELLKDFERFFVSEAPDVVPVSGGGVQFEWQYASRELEIEFSNPDEIAYLKVFEDESMQEGVFSIEYMDTEISNLILWLFLNN